MGATAGSEGVFAEQTRHTRGSLPDACATTHTAHQCVLTCADALALPPRAAQEGAFVVTITYSSINLLMSNYIMRFQDMQQSWISFLRCAAAAAPCRWCRLRYKHMTGQLRCAQRAAFWASVWRAREQEKAESPHTSTAAIGSLQF